MNITLWEERYKSVIVGSGVDEVFVNARERFTGKRKDGARRLPGSGKPAAGLLWSARDLRMEIG